MGLEIQSDHAHSHTAKSVWTDSLASDMDNLTVSELIGAKRHFAPVQSWFDSWAFGTPSVYPLILVGDSGVGKSTVARAYAQRAGFDILDTHADAQRDVKHFNRVFSEARNRTFFGENRCLIVEDAGAISAKAWKSFDDVISAKAFPLVIIAQHESEVGWRYRKSGLVHEIPAPTSSDKVQLLNSICPDHSPEQILWIAENSSSWRSAKHLAATTPSDFIDPNVNPSERTRFGHDEVSGILSGQYQSKELSSHPLAFINAAEWNGGNPEHVCEAMRLHSLAWGVDGLSKVSMAYISTLRADTQHKPPFRKRNLRGSDRRW